jgi:transcriptional regulator with GAF, ATPase, and Fis domain
MHPKAQPEVEQAYAAALLRKTAARGIRKRSRRSQRAFVSVNCAALAPSLISSELFGHEKGAFTGTIGMRDWLSV